MSATSDEIEGGVLDLQAQLHRGGTACASYRQEIAGACREIQQLQAECRSLRDVIRNDKEKIHQLKNHARTAEAARDYWQGEAVRLSGCEERAQKAEQERDAAQQRERLVHDEWSAEYIRMKAELNGWLEQCGRERDAAREEAERMRESLARMASVVEAAQHLMQWLKAYADGNAWDMAPAGLNRVSALENRLIELDAQTTIDKTTQVGDGTETGSGEPAEHRSASAQQTGGENDH